MSAYIQSLVGTGVALVTPFDEQDTIDWGGLKRLLQHVTSGGVDFVVALGTTSESATLSAEEKHSIVEFIKKNTRLPVVVGCGGNNTRQVISDMHEWNRHDLAAILSVVPYYTRPPQSGLEAHFTALANASNHPVILYNVPGRTSCNLDAETTIRLSAHPNIIGIKEASPDMKQIQTILSQSTDGFMLWSGDDAMTTAVIGAGGIGTISVLANYMPDRFCRLVKESLSGNPDTAKTINDSLQPYFDLMMAEGNPASVKTALEALGLIHRRVRLPLMPGSDELLRRFM